MRDEKAWKWLNENELSYKIWNNKYRHNNESFDEWLDRVSGNNSYIRNLIERGKFCFGGRILSNRGIDKGSMANCTTLGRVEDSISGIMDAATKLALSFQAEQGQGLSLTDIRPKGALIRCKYPSEGILPFMEIFNTTTQAIQQGGVRRGALLMSISVWHKDAEDFIKVKSDFNKINNANLSLEIDDEFLRYVESDYKTGKETVVHLKKKYGESEIEYDVCPIKLYKMICEHAYKYAEPCILYTNRLFNYNLMEYVEEYEIQCTNACSEEPMLAHALCVLSSFNLSEYILDPYTSKARFDFSSFMKDIPYVVEAMDDVVEENIYKNPLPEQVEVAKRWRNFGVGIMGMADALVKLGIRYGSQEAVEFASNIMKIMFRTSFMADMDLADKRGAFPGFTNDVWDAEILKNNFDLQEIQDFKKAKRKLRNCSLLSVAPNGSIGTMLKGGISTGTEPFFALQYNRTTKTLDGKDSTYKCQIQALKDYQRIACSEDIPDYFVTAQNISWKERIDMQAALQQANDTAISSTCNLRETATVKDVEELYLYAWKKGCKGMSIYVENSRPPILEASTTKKKEENTVLPNLDSITPITRKELGKKLEGASYKCKNACGGLYITINNTPNGDLVEVFANPTKQGGCKANLESLTRQVSDAMRSGIKISSIIDSLAKVQCQACVRAKAKGEELDGSSCGDIVAKCIQDRYNELHNIKPTQVQKKQPGDGVTTCPECGEKLRYEQGCRSCSCGWSKCG